MNRIILFLLINVCGQISHAQISYYLSNKFWRLKHAVINGREYPLTGNSNAPTLQFSGGSIRGNGGCNAYHTKFTINGSSLYIDKIMSTRMACNSLELEETEYFNALAQSHNLEYEEGSSEFRLINTSNDVLIFYSQFERNPSSYSPPPAARRERVVHYSDNDNETRPALSKKQTRRKADLEKKLKRGKLSKAERRELISLQSKAKKGSAKGKKGKTVRGKKGKRDRVVAKKSAKGKKAKTKAKENASKKKKRRR